MSMINKGPSIRTFSNDTEMINHINQISGNSFATIADALTWVNGQNDYYIQNRDVGFVTTDGLVFNVDAGQVSSFPKGGTTWYDLSVNSNNGTLTNGPTYSTNGGGSISFDSLDDTVLFTDVPINTTLGEGNTVDQWLYWDGLTSEMSFTWGVGSNLALFFGTSAFGFNNGSSLLYGIPFDDLSNKWLHVTAFFPSDWSAVTYQDAKLYINGVKQDISIFEGALRTRTLTSPTNVNISGSFNSIGDIVFGGDIALTRIWNRELTDEEVYLNYLGSVNRFYNWILASGNWDDSSIWVDEETW